MFLDLFSANDVASSRLLLQKAGTGLTAEAGAWPLVALLSSRADRPLRTRAFTDWLTAENVFQLCCPLGDHAFYAGRRLRRGGSNVLPGLGLFNVFPKPALLLQAVRRALGRDGFLLVGLGNAHGYGERFRNYLTESAG